jgi:hypothetical protein
VNETGLDTDGGQSAGGGDNNENADFSTSLKQSATRSHASDGCSNSKVTNQITKQNATQYCERIRLQYLFQSLSHYDTV